MLVSSSSDGNSSTTYPSTSVMCEFLLMGAGIDAICNDIGSECDDGDAEAGKEIAEHNAIVEERVLAPCFPLCPGVSIKGEVGHLA